MKNSTIFYGISLFFLMLLAACTQNEMNIDTAQNETVTARSTQAECDQLQANLPPPVPPLPCGEIAELFECRLNQGINEDSLGTQCDLLGTYMQSICLNVNDLLNNPQQVVNEIKLEVMNNVGTCPPTCLSPSPFTGCTQILFEVVSVAIGSCNTQTECAVQYQAQVCCK